MKTSDAVTLAGPTSLEMVRELPASPERVWEFLTNPDLRKRWFCGGETEGRVGGVMVFEFDHRRLSDSPPTAKNSCAEVVSFNGTVTAWDPPRTLAFLWPAEDGGDTLVTITLKPVDGGSRLHLVHERLANAGDRTGAAAGWHAHIDLLSDLLSDRTPRDFWKTYTPLEADYRKRFEVDAS